MKHEKLTWFKRLSIWWRFDGQYLHYDFYYGVKNIFKWFKVVWKDRDYDDTFIFEVLKFKIQNTAQFTEKKKRFVGWEIEVSRMKTCVELINRIQNEYYGMEYLNYYESNHEFVESELRDVNGEPLYEMKSEVISNDFDEYFKKYKNTHRKLLNKYGESLENESLALRVSNINHEKAKKLLFNILNKHIESWWD